MRLFSLKSPAPPLQIGLADDDEGNISIPYASRDAHLHVIGRTRSGKSRFLADLIRQDIVNGKGLALIDPHAELYNLTVNWLAQSQNRLVVDTRKIHPITLSDPTTTLRFNPLHIDHPDEAQAVGGEVANTLTRIFGGNDPNATPLIKSTLDMICVLLAMRGLPLVAAQFYLFDKYQSQRRKILEGITDPYYRDLGEEFEKSTKREFRETAGSSERRLRKFIANPIVRRIFSTTTNTLNIRKMMDERHVVLINSAKGDTKLIAEDELRSIAMLFVRSTFDTAFTRPPESKPTPFYLYIDEVQNYVSDDIERVLSQSAKFGLMLTLSHQILEHLAQAGPEIYTGVMSGTLIKAVFAIPMLEAHVFADELFADEVDFERIKENVKAPATVGHTIGALASQSTTEGVSEGITETEGTADTETDSTGITEGTAIGIGIGQSTTKGWSQSTVISSGRGSSQGGSTGIGVATHHPADDSGSGVVHVTEAQNAGQSSGLIETAGRAATDSSMASDTITVSKSKTTSSQLSKSKATSHQTSRSSALSNSKSNSLTEGVSATLIPDIQWIATQTYTLEEQRYDLARRINRQKKRHGFLAIMGEAAVGFTTRDIPDPLKMPKAERALIERLTDKSAWLSFSAEQTIELDVGSQVDASETTQTPEPSPDDYFDEE